MKKILVIGEGVMGSTFILKKINKKRIPLMINLLRAILKNKRLII
jgi:hypothetical protein